MDEIPHLLASIIGTGAAPGSLSPVIVVKINTALFIFLPAIELPKVQVTRSEVVVNNIQDDCNASLCASRTNNQRHRVHINALDRKNIRRVIAPGKIACEFGNGHDLDGVHFKPFQMPQLLQRIIEPPSPF
jgi:hypothetical protein